MRDLPHLIRRISAELQRRHVYRVGVAYLVTAWAAIQVADTVVPRLGLPDALVTGIIVLSGVGLPIALVLAWALELTPEGIRRTDEVESGAGTLHSEVDAGHRRMPIATAILVVLALLVGAAAVRWKDRLPGGNAPPGAPRTIAVLPFTDLSEGGDQQYFGDGLAEELIAGLARLDGLRVAARSASFRFRDPGLDVKVAGRRLSVQGIVEGSVRRTGDRVRVAVSVVDAGTGFEIWSDVFERDAGDVFAVQEEIAQAVVRALGLSGPADARLVERGTENLEAYDHLLRGNYRLIDRTAANVRAAEAEYAEAARLDPAWATPVFREAYALLVYADWGWPYPGRTGRQLLSRAEVLVDSALVRAPDSADGWLARAYLRVLEDPYRLSGSVDAFRRAIAIDSTQPEAFHQYGQTLMALGRDAEAHEAYLRALRLDPARPFTLIPLAAIALHDGRVAEARAWEDSALAVEPANSYARAGLARILLAAGDTAGAVREARLAARLDNAHAVPVLSTLAVALAAAGEQAEARRAFSDAVDRAGAPPYGVTPGTYLGMAAVGLGDRARALELLSATEPRGAWFWFYLQSPIFDGLRSDPAFRRLVDPADPRPEATRS